jgi:hypothetical protein
MSHRRLGDEPIYETLAGGRTPHQVVVSATGNATLEVRCRSCGRVLHEFSEPSQEVGLAELREIARQHRRAER